MSLTKVTKVLTAVDQEVTMYCEGMAKAGINIRSVTGTPTLKFYGSLDGLTFTPITVGPFPSATPSAAGVTSATAAGSWEVNVQNYKFLRVQMTSGAGPATVVLTASVDASYQEAFLTDSQGVSQAVLFPCTTSNAGVNTMTIPAQAGRTINLTFLEVSQVGPGQGGNAVLRIWDGSVGNGFPLHMHNLTAPVGSVGLTYSIALPTDADGKVGINGTPGNALVIQIINLGNVSANLNARVSYI